MERNRSLSLASDSSSLSMDSWSLVDESADEAPDRQQHNVFVLSHRRTSSVTNLALHNSHRHSSSFGEFSEIPLFGNNNDDYDAEMESIRSNEVQIVGQQLLTELQEEDERNLLQQLNDARKCEILAPPILHAYDEPAAAAAVNKNASEREEFAGFTPFDQQIFCSPPVESTFTFLKPPGQRICFSEKNYTRYYVPDTYLTETDDEEVRVRNDDVNKNVRFTWLYQKILSSTSMPTEPLVEEQDEEQQESVDWSARWGLDDDDSSSDVLPSLPSSASTSPQSSFSAADESEIEANADKSNILIGTEEEITDESCKNGRKTSNNESESYGSMASEQLAIVAESEPIFATHEGGCTIQHEIPSVAQSPAIIDNQFECELGSVTNSSDNSSATMDTDNDSLTMAAEPVEEAKLKMKENESIPTEMVPQWIPLESVVPGSVAVESSVSFEGSDQTSAAAVETISVSDEKQLASAKNSQSVESSFESFVEITVEKSEQNEFIQHEFSMRDNAQLQNSLSKSSSTTVTNFVKIANDTDDLFIVSSSSSDVQSTTSLPSIDSAERHISVPLFASNNASTTSSAESTSTTGMRIRCAKIRRSIENMTTNDEPPLFEFNPFDLFDCVAAKVSSTWAKINSHERIVIHCLLLALVLGCICSAHILHSFVIGSRMHYNRSHYPMHPRQQLRNGEIMPIAFDSERFIDEQYYHIEPKESEYDNSFEDESENVNKYAFQSGILMAKIRENKSQKSVLFDDDGDYYCFEPQKMFEFDRQSFEKVAKQSKWKNDKKKEQQTEILLIDQRQPLKQARDEYFRLKLTHNKAAISPLRETVSSLADNHQQRLQQQQKNSLSKFVIAKSLMPPITATERLDEGNSAETKMKRLLLLKIIVKRWIWMEVDEHDGIKRPRYSIVENVVLDERKETSLDEGDPTNGLKSFSANNKVCVKKWSDVGSVWQWYTIEEEMDEQVSSNANLNGREGVVSGQIGKANEPSLSLAYIVNASMLESASFSKNDAHNVNSVSVDQQAREPLRRRDRRIEAFSSHETHLQAKLNRQRKFYDSLELNMPQGGDWFQQRQRQRSWLRRQEASRQRQLQKLLARWHWTSWTVTDDGHHLCDYVFDPNFCTMESYLCVEL